MVVVVGGGGGGGGAPGLSRVYLAYTLYFYSEMSRKEEQTSEQQSP